MSHSKPGLIRSLNILIAEDNPDDIFLLQEAAKKAGVTSRLYAVRDGVETLEYLSGDGAFADRNTYPFPDVLLLDLSMPRMNGFELLEQLRSDPRFSSLVVHILTASGRDEDVDRAYRLHANSYLVKPTRVDQLVQLLALLQQWHGLIRLPTIRAEPRPLLQTS